MRDDLIERLRSEADISARPAQMDRLNALADEFAAALAAARQRIAELERELENERARGSRAWDEGFQFARRSLGWNSNEDPATEGLYVVRDSKGNVEVGMWYAKTFNGQPAGWSKEFRDVDREDIVAWMMVPNI